MVFCRMHDPYLKTVFRRLETEINEKLFDVHQKLLQAGVDQKETEREAKMKENLANLQRIFPGAWLSLVCSSCI